MSAIEDCLQKLSDGNYPDSNPVIIKSTVSPDQIISLSEYCNLNICLNPEFLRESTTPNEDFENQKDNCYWNWF